MAARNPERDDATTRDRQNPEGETFKREGPTPPENSTGGSIDDMNRAAEDSLVRNIRPDDATD